MADFNGGSCFWIVWNPSSETPPRVQYKTRKAAQYAARKMAEEYAHEGAYFYVMKAQSCHQVQGTMTDFIIAAWGIGAPCPLHGAVGSPVLTHEKGPGL
jgi:hypothetical protein